MNCFILKNSDKKEAIQPEDLLVLNEDGTVRVFPEIKDAWNFIDENNLKNAETFFIKR